MPAIKGLIRNEAGPDNFIKALSDMKADFEMYCSNYAIKIITDEQIINFTQHEQNRQTFAAYAKLKHDLKDLPKPDVTENDVTYFLHDFREPIYVERVVNIDLKSAYANVLLMDNLISKETYSYLKKLAKKDRLSAVGMLASRKEVFEYSRGEVSDMRTERSEFSPFFFYAVKRVFQIMNELKKICGKSYLFTWVDGIYFLPDPEIKKTCTAYLDKIKFPYSTEMLNEFEVKFLPRSIKVSFLKEKTNRKYFDLPIPESAFQKLLRNEIFINNKNKTK